MPVTDPLKLRDLIVGMRAAYSRKENAMAYARRALDSAVNLSEATLVAYDLQAGDYVARVRRSPADNDRWCEQVATLLRPWVGPHSTLLEIGAGEATTLAGVLQSLETPPAQAYGFDISWSRCAQGVAWLEEQAVPARLFVGDLFDIPLANESIDVVYTSHSLEPNGGREEAALRELLRITRRALILVEPVYELASAPAQARMRDHGYVRNLAATVNRLGYNTSAHHLLPYSPNAQNPSGVIVVEKSGGSVPRQPQFECPLTRAALHDAGDVYCAESTGIVYPVLRGIPMLRSEHAIVASKLAPAVPAFPPEP